MTLELVAVGLTWNTSPTPIRFLNDIITDLFLNRYL